MAGQVTYNSLYTLVQQQINNSIIFNNATPLGNQICATISAPQSNSTSVMGSQSTTELMSAIQQLLQEALPQRIISGLYVTATEPNSGVVNVAAGTGTVGGIVYELTLPVAISIPFDNYNTVFYVNLVGNGVTVNTTGFGDTQLTLAKIIVPAPGVTTVVSDKNLGDDVTAYINQYQTFNLYADQYGNLEPDSLEFFRDNIGCILANNLIGNIELSQSLQITNQQGSLCMDSCSINFYDTCSDLLSRIDQTGAYYYNNTGAPIAMFSTSGACVGNIDIFPHSLQSSNFVSGPMGAGFQITDAGNAQFNNISARGSFSTTVFQACNVSAIGGSLLVLNADTLNANLATTQAVTLCTCGASSFQVNDVLRMKTALNDEWFCVTGCTLGTNTYTVARDLSGNYPTCQYPTWMSGTAILDYGQSGSGGIYMTASDVNEPYLSIFCQAGTPWTCLCTFARLGQLNGFLGYTNPAIGIAIGDTNRYLKYDPTNGLNILGTASITGGVAVGTPSKSGLYFAGDRFGYFDGTNWDAYICCTGTFAFGGINIGGIDSNTQLMLHLNNNFVDYSHNNFIVTNYNTSFVSGNPFTGSNGYSANFNGTSNYITVPNSSAFCFGSGNFTFEMWVTSFSNSIQGLFSQYCGDNNNYFTFYQNNGCLVFEWIQSGSLVACYVTTNTVWLLATGQHIAAVRNGTCFSIYVGGVSKSLSVGTAIGSTSLAQLNMPMVIGNSNGSYFCGYISEVRISNVARWTSNFTPPVQPYENPNLLSNCMCWNGSTLNIRGTLDASDLCAGVITGLQIQTAYSNPRVYMDPTCFVTYDANSCKVFCIDLAVNVGDVYMGDSTSGSYLHWQRSSSSLQFNTCSPNGCYITCIGAGSIIANYLTLCDPAGSANTTFLGAGSWWFIDPTGNCSPYVKRICSGSASTGTCICLNGWCASPSVLVTPRSILSYNSTYSTQCQQLNVYADTPVWYCSSSTVYGYCFGIHAQLVLSSGTGAQCVDNSAFGACVCTNTSTCATCFGINFQLWCNAACANYYYGTICYAVCYRLLCCSPGGAWCACCFSFTQPHGNLSQMQTTTADCHSISFGSSCQWQLMPCCVSVTWTNSGISSGTSVTNCYICTRALGNAEVSSNLQVFGSLSGSCTCSYTCTATITIAGSNPGGTIYCTYVCYCWCTAECLCASGSKYSGVVIACACACTYLSNSLAGAGYSVFNVDGSNPTFCTWTATPTSVALPNNSYTSFTLNLFLWDQALASSGAQAFSCGDVCFVGGNLYQCYCCTCCSGSAASCLYDCFYGTIDTLTGQTILDASGCLNWLATSYL